MVLTVDPETSNLPKRVAFPVLIANMVAALAPDGIPAADPARRTAGLRAARGDSLGRDRPAFRRTRAAPVRITRESEQRRRRRGWPVSRDVVYTDTGAAGVYTVTETDAAGIDLGTTRFVVNAGHPRESDLRLDPDLASVLATASGADVTAPRQERVDLWPLLALLAWLVIAAEWIASTLAGRSGARRSGPARGGAA